MIYNLYQYIITNSSLSPVVNGWTSATDDKTLMIKETGGEQKPVIGTINYMVQAMARNSTSDGARTELYTLFNLLSNRFGIVLPTITVNSIIYQEVQTAQILSMQMPAHIGADDSNRQLWSVNFKITV